MFQKIEILEALKSGFNRFFKASFKAGIIKHSLQYSSGGEDYNPPKKIEAIGGFIDKNPNNSLILVYKDHIDKISAPGEKRIYATDAAGNKVVSEIHLKNNGDIVIKATGKIYTQGDLEHTGNLKVIGKLVADEAKINNGKTGTYDKVQASDGIIVGGS